MLFFSIFILIIFNQIKIIFPKNFIVNYHSEYISIMDVNGISENYDLDLISSGKMYLNIESNLISQINYLFYYLTYNDITWKSIISKSRNYFIIYCENLNTFYSKINELIQLSRIKQIIVGVDSLHYKKELNLSIYNNNDLKIFINKNQDEIRNKYYSFSGKIFCSTYIYFYYSGDVYADFLVEFFFIFIMVFLFVWLIIHYKARKNGNYLFIHSYILAILLFYLFHTFIYLILVNKQKDKYFDDEIFSGALYNTYNFFQFFIKLLPALFSTIQLNIFELNEHYRIIRNSKVIHIISANIFFVISLENENEILSEMLNGFLYILTIICLFYMFMQFKNCLDEKILDSIIEDPEYTPTLKYKKKLLFTHSFCIFSFTIAYYIFIFIFRNNFAEYRTIKFIIVMINYSDLFLVILLTIIHFPRKLPQRYIEEIIFEDINLNNDENDYFEKIYAYEQIEEENYFENYKEENNANIIIIENPFNENKLEAEIEQDEIEENEEEEEKENKERNKNDEKNNNHFETTEEDSNDNNNKNNNIKTDNEIKENNNNNRNNEDEQNALVIKEETINNKSLVKEDILDLYHTKLGYIEI